MASPIPALCADKVSIGPGESRNISQLLDASGNINWDYIDFSSQDASQPGSLSIDLVPVSQQGTLKTSGYGNIIVNNDFTLVGDNSGSQGGTGVFDRDITISGGSRFTVKDSAATKGHGGALYANHGLYLHSPALFSQNSTDYQDGHERNGGAIWTGDGLMGSSASLTFSRNLASSGGAVYSQGPVAFLKGVTFRDNVAEGVYDSNPLQYPHQSKPGYGGAIYSGQDISAGREALFYRNHAMGSGGAVYGRRTITFDDHLQLIENQARDHGGGSLCGRHYQYWRLRPY